MACAKLMRTAYEGNASSDELITAERLRILARSGLLGAGNEEVYDRFTRLAATILDSPVSLVTLVDKDRQYFKSYYGLPEPWASQRQTPLSHSFCKHVVASHQPLIVKDAREEAVLRNNLGVSELGIVAYLGFPLIAEDQALGSFCVIDNKPRAWSEREISIVRELASFVTTEIAFSIEIAERQKVTERLLESEERFRTLDRELHRQQEAFLSMTTHELKSPLAAIQASIQLAQRRLHSLERDNENLNEKQRATLTQTMNSLTRGMENLQVQSRLINDLHDLSRLHAGKLTYQKVPVNLKELVRQAVQDQQTAYPQRDITYILPDETPCIVLADPQRTRQVLNNYLTNALKYSPPEQPVQAGMHIEANVVRVWVQDHGNGLTQEQQEHIWERFYQTHETPVYTGTPGLGLGLHICQALIQGQQGEVGVTSTRGEGSTFWFTLPL